MYMSHRLGYWFELIRSSKWLTVSVYYVTAMIAHEFLQVYSKGSSYVNGNNAACIHVLIERNFASVGRALVSKVTPSTRLHKRQEIDEYLDSLNQPSGKRRWHACNFRSIDGFVAATSRSGTHDTSREDTTRRSSDHLQLPPIQRHQLDLRRGYSAHGKCIFRHLRSRSQYRCSS